MVELKAPPFHPVSYRRRPASMAKMGPGFRRDDNVGDVANSRSGHRRYPIVELKAPPSRSRFWPTINPDEAAHRKAQAAPNSAGLPTRPVGLVAERLASISSNEMFWRRASNSIPERSRSVRKGPGKRPLIVTL